MGGRRRVSRWVLLAAVPFWAAAIWLHTKSPLHVYRPQPPRTVQVEAPRAVPPPCLYLKLQSAPNCSPSFTRDPWYRGRLGDYPVRSRFEPLGLARGRYPRLLLGGS